MSKPYVIKYQYSFKKSRFGKSEIKDFLHLIQKEKNYAWC